MASNDLVQLSAVELRRMIGAKQLSPVELLDACIAQIEAINPAVNAICATDFDGARAQAKRDEQAVMDGDELGVVHGLPCGVKDLQITGGLLTTHGSPQHKNDVPGEDELMVSRIRESGANIFCKTNTPEFGAGSNTRNAVWGATGNPFNPTLNAGGSSGGTGVALACNMMPVATGSDMGGSLRNPAAWNGVVGFRTTAGTVPTDKKAQAWNPTSIDGAMGRSVEDLCLLLSTMVGDANMDPLARDVHPIDFLHLDRIDLSTLRVAFSTDLGGFAPIDNGYRRVFEQKRDLIQGFFGEVDENQPGHGDVDKAFDIVRALGYMVKHKATYEKDPNLLGQNVRENYKLGLKYSLADAAWAHQEHTAHMRRYAEFFETYDLLITPTTAISPFPWEINALREINGETFDKYYTWMRISWGVSMSGHPAFSLPCGLDQNGMPFGIQVVGAFGRDAELAAMALALEQTMAGNAATARPVPDLSKLSQPAPALKSIVTDPPGAFT
jgi:amidase